MGFTKNTASTTNISDLPVQPTISAIALQALFDKFSADDVPFENSLIDELEASTSAGNLGATAITDLTGGTIQTILESIRNNLKSTTDGSSGANFVKVTAILGVTGAEIQTVLESLKALIDLVFTKVELESQTDGSSGMDIIGMTPIDGVMTTPQQSLEYLKVRVDANNPTLNIVSVADYGAVLDGIFDDTIAVNLAIADLTDDSNLFFPTTPGGCRITDKLTLFNLTNILIYGNAKIILDGADAGFFLDGTCENITFEDLTFEGDGTINNATQGVITNLSGTIVNQIRCINLKFSELPFGIYFNADLGGEYIGALASGCSFKNMVGTASGSGVGIAIAGKERNIGSRIIGCYFENCSRHSLYIASATSVTIIGNTFKLHRSTVTPSPILAALQVSRSNHVTIQGNTFDRCADAALQLITDDNILCDNISVVGNIFNKNELYDIRLGNDSPLLSGIISNVSIIGNIFNRETAETFTPFLYQSGLNVVIEDNIFNLVDMSATTIVIDLLLNGDETSSGNTKIANNIIKGTNISGNIRAIFIRTQLATGIQRCEIRDNIIDADVPIFLQSTITNPNLSLTARRETYVSSVPTTGTWKRGDVAYHNLPSAGGNYGWICVADGTPGTWKTFGVITV